MTKPTTTEPTTTEPAAPTGGTETEGMPEPEHPSSVAGINERIDRLAEMVREFVSRRGGSDEQAGDISGEVKRELARLQAAEKRKAAADGQAAELASVKQELKKMAEKKPMEYRAIENFMRWRNEDEK